MDNGVTVTGTGQASAPADRLQLILSVGCDADEVSTAIERLTSRTDAVLTALRDRGLTGSDVQTSGLHVHRGYEQQVRETPTYRATHQITVASRDLDGFGALVDACVQAAGNDLGLDHVGFDVADQEELLAQAREAAFADARGKAEHLARLAGRTLGPIQSVSHGGHDLGGPPAPFAARSAATAELAVAPADHTANASLTVQWAWA